MILQARAGGLIGELPVSGRRYQPHHPPALGEGHCYPPQLGYGEQQQVARLRIGGDDAAPVPPSGQLSFYRGPAASFGNGTSIGQASLPTKS